MSVLVRPAATEDLPLLGPLEVAAGARFAEVGMTEIAADAPPTLASYAEAAEDGRLWVAELDGAVVGYVWARDLAGQPHLEQISVLPTAGGRGVGRSLVDQVVRWAAGRGGTSLTLSTFRNVPWNGPWYAALGFSEIPSPEVAADERLAAVVAEERAHGLDVSDRVLMRRPLAPAAG